MKYIDIHSHLNFPEYDPDREAVLARMAETETGTIVVGTDLDSSKRAVDLAEEHEYVWASIGVHPADDPHKTFEVSKFLKLVNHPKVVAIGECGLDFFHARKEEDYERQKRLFLQQAYFAIEGGKPLMIHSRDAYEELLEILEPLKKQYGHKLRGDIHFFAGSLEIAKRFWDIGFATSFTGVITFAKNYDEVIKHAPLEMLMSETDSPFVAPAPYRGKRNEPAYVKHVVERIADIRGEDLETVRTSLLDNACRVFGIVIG